VVSAGGRTDFASIEELHAWWTLTREPGETVEVVVLRGGERRVLEVNVLP
jgi:S1-C subfamily serine protease